MRGSDGSGLGYVGIIGVFFKGLGVDAKKDLVRAKVDIGKSWGWIRCVDIHLIPRDFKDDQIELDMIGVGPILFVASV